MDYEKAYKDALEKARFLRQQAAAGGNPLMANRYEQIFPQLAESEDEKTRKDLVNFILYKAGHLLDEETEHRFIAFLEGLKTDGKAMLHVAEKSYQIGLRDGRMEQNTEPFSWGHENGSSEKPKQEWSEEDEKDIAHIIRVLDDCYAYGRHDLSLTDHENLIGTLKSISPQPHWKPSEDQMMILRWAANGMVDESIAAPEMRAVLRELYNDLKKL